METSPTELSMYYVEHYRTDTCRIRRCTLRPDGFVSVHAPYSGGGFVTKPLRFRGQHLRINYATSAVGFVKAEIQDASGKPISSFGMQDSTEIFGASACPPSRRNAAMIGLSARGWTGSRSVSPGKSRIEDF